MNEFTKEELEQILFDMNDKIFRFDKNHVSESYIALRDKVELMIDNYCEHERCSPNDALNVPLHCLDCGEKFE